MTVIQTTTIIFQYPQDYMQEQEWCKTKDDRWIHIGTDTLGSIYENQISYCIGPAVAVQSEPKRGEWEEREIFCVADDNPIITEWQSARCSKCNKYHTTPYMYYFSNYNFCPNCGAQMKGVDDE